MPLKQEIVAFTIAFSIFIVILELVREKKLREEYSWLWLLTSAGLIILTIRYDILIWITYMIGAVLPTSTLFFFAIIFLMLVCIQFSIRISRLTNQVKDLTQEITILRANNIEKIRT
ncbi:MAG: DUF2304 domain-containing protein [Nitrospirae bacterium]|jgi:hypothetical protein|nr:DUF2304 domain-containing protein [Nitrospirota bacterium]